MIQYSTVLLIFLFIILIIVIVKKTTISFDITKYFDGANNLNINSNNLEGFKGNKNNKDFFGEKLDIRKTNQYKKIF